MSLTDIVYTFLKHPYPLWEYELTKALVEKKLNELGKYGLAEPNEYSTARCINDYSLPPVFKLPILENKDGDNIYLEAATESLKEFYEEHGLNTYTEKDLQSNLVLPKLKRAMAILELVEPAHSCIRKLVRSIQALHQVDKEIDTSYSHPKIPFSIFVSVCEDDSTLSSLRVAESILHEAMHLKLTLIEGTVELIKPNTGNLFFSPWRDEKRPAQGVLHGLFVFSAILNFFEKLDNAFDSENVINYLNTRKEQIEYEVMQLKDFASCADLTPNGAILTKNLLPLN